MVITIVKPLINDKQNHKLPNKSTLYTHCACDTMHALIMHAYCPQCTILRMRGNTYLYVAHYLEIHLQTPLPDPEKAERGTSAAAVGGDHGAVVSREKTVPRQDDRNPQRKLPLRRCPSLLHAPDTSRIQGCKVG